MAFNTNDLQGPGNLDRSISRYLRNFMAAPTNFGDINRAFSGMMSKPSLMEGPGGALITPQQQNEAAGTAMLGERGAAAGQNLQDKMSAADELTGLGSNIASIFNTIPFLNAMRMNSSGNNMFGGLMSGGGIF